MKMKREKTKNKPNRNGKLENTIPTFKYTEKSSKKKRCDQVGEYQNLCRVH